MSITDPPVIAIGLTLAFSSFVIGWWLGSTLTRNKCRSKHAAMLRDIAKNITTRKLIDLRK